MVPSMFAQQEADEERSSPHAHAVHSLFSFSSYGLFRTLSPRAVASVDLPRTSYSAVAFILFSLSLSLSRFCFPTRRLPTIFEEGRARNATRVECSRLQQCNSSIPGVYRTNEKRILILSFRVCGFHGANERKHPFAKGRARSAAHATMYRRVGQNGTPGRNRRFSAYSRVMKKILIPRGRHAAILPLRVCRHFSCPSSPGVPLPRVGTLKASPDPRFCIQTSFSMTQKIRGNYALSEEKYTFRRYYGSPWRTINDMGSDTP